MLNSLPVHPDPTSPAESLTTKLAWTILITATLAICYFSHLGAIGFVGPDEPRYAWIARAMYETGDWVTPRLYGQPWFEKPVLYYWGAAASFKLFGVSEAAARLPSALSALLATLALAWLALRLYGKETARWLLLLLPTSVGMIGFSHAASTDMPFSGMLTVAMVCAAVAVGLTRNEHTPVIERTPWLALIGFGFFLGAAVLAKGPAAIILSGGAIFFWAVFTKRWRDAFRLFHPVALLTFFATALPWYILCARRNPTFFHVFIIEHNFNRYLTPEFQHLQPFWYYLPVLLVAVLPWIAILLFAIYAQTKNLLAKNHTGGNTIFFWTWALFCILFFSTSHSKLPGYILPAFPAFAVLLSSSFVLEYKAEKPGLRKYFYIISALLFAAALLMDPDIRPPKHLAVFEADLASAILVAIALPGFCLGCSLGTLGKPAKKRVYALIGVSVVPVVLLVAYFFFPIFRKSLSPRELAAMTSARNLGNSVTMLRVNRSQLYSLNYYFHREMQEWNPAIRGDAYVITSLRECLKLKGSDKACQLVEFGGGTDDTSLSLYKIQPAAATKDRLHAISITEPTSR